jgi:hypothetical protein
MIDENCENFIVPWMFFQFLFYPYVLPFGHYELNWLLLNKEMSLVALKKAD